MYFTKLRKNLVIKNFTYVTIGSVLAQLLNLIAIIKIAKIFSPENYGLYTFITVQGALVYTLADVGIRNILIRTIARDKNSVKDVIYTGILLRLITVAVFSGIYFLYNTLAGKLDHSYILLICIYSLSNCITTLFESVFWGLQKMLAPAIVNVSTSILWLAMIFFLPARDMTVALVFILFIAVNLLTGVCYFVILKLNKLVVGQKQQFLKSTSALLKQSWPYFILVLLTLPYNYLTNNFLDINSTKTEIGYYNLTQKLISPISLVITFSLSALFPNLSSLWMDDKEKFNRIINKGITIFMVTSLLLCFTYTLFAEYIISLLFSNKYWAVIKVSKIQIWFVFLMGMNSLIGTILGATNNEKLLVKYSVINIVISAPMLYYGSKFGAIGLSYAYVLSFIIFEMYLWTSFRRSITVKVNANMFLWITTMLLFFLSYFILDKASFALKASADLIILAIVFWYLRKSKMITA